MTAAELPPDDWAADPIPLDPWAAADRLAATVKPRPPAPPEPEPEPPRLEYPDAAAFVAGYLSPVYRRPLGAGQTWCPEWWRHSEGRIRLEALWRSWEHLRLDKTGLGMSVWFRDHADVHMAVLLDGDGPFHGCSVDKGHNGARLVPLTVAPPPEGAFPTQKGDTPPRVGV